jgi:hypothetical protein
MTARRAIWIIRGILYPSLALAAALVLTHRGGDDDAAAWPVTVYGKTSQGFDVNASFRDGRIYRLHTHVRSYCPGARPAYTWTVDDPNAYFDIHGDAIRVRSTATWKNEWSVMHHLRIDARHRDGGLTGTMSAVLDVYAPFTGTCRSGKVTFNAHE